MPRPKVVVFDMDGVLVDSVEIAAQFSLETFPGLTPEKQKEILCGNFHEEIKKLDAFRIVETPEEAEARKAKYVEQKSRSLLYPGVKKLLQELRDGGIILVINTSAFKNRCWPILENQGITNFFDFIADAEVGLSKVEKFKLIADKYQVTREEMIFVTDTLGDLREADQVGISTIAVTWGAHDHYYFTREPHANLVKIVDTVEELREGLLSI